MKGLLQHVSPQESFSCSLGVDPSIRITYHPLRQKTKSSGSVLTTKTTSTAYEQAITIKNTRLAPVENLRVRDRIPVSRDARIKVTLVEPKTLAEGNLKNRASTMTATARAGQATLVARWVPRDEFRDAVPASPAGAVTAEMAADAAQGLLEWVCDIASGATADVILAWDISAPSGVEWVYEGM